MTNKSNIVWVSDYEKAKESGGFDGFFCTTDGCKENSKKLEESVKKKLEEIMKGLRND